MTRIETALRAMLEDVEYIDDMSDPLRVEGRMLATPTGQALAALVEAAEAMDRFHEDELIMYSDEEHPDPVMTISMRHAFDDEADSFHRAVDAFRAATEPGAER